MYPKLYHVSEVSLVDSIYGVYVKGLFQNSREAEDMFRKDILLW